MKKQNFNMSVNLKKLFSSSKVGITKTEQSSTDIFSESMPTMNPHHKKVYEIGEDIMTWAPNGNKYSWQAVSESMQLDPDSVKFDYQPCLNCGNHSTILFAYHDSPFVYDNEEKEYMLVCPVCKTLFHKDNIEQYCSKESYGDYMMRLKKEICEINPKFSALFDVFDEMGCGIEYCKDIGLYGAIRIKYRSQYLYIWIREEDPFMICYPNWHSMNKAQMSSFKLDSIIRPINMSHSSSIVWEVNYDMVLLSSFGNILLGSDNGSNLESVKRLFDELIETPYYFDAGYNGKTIQCDDTDKSDVNTLLSILENSGCSKVEVDDDGDIAIVYNDRNILARIINGNFIKISYNSSQYEDVSQERIPDDYESGISQTFQWNNIIFPIKCSYYIPIKRIHSVTVYMDFNILPNYEDNVAFVKQILPMLIDADNNQLSGYLLSSSDEAIEDINTWCVLHKLPEQMPREK